MTTEEKNLQIDEQKRSTLFVSQGNGDNGLGAGVTIAALAIGAYLLLKNREEESEDDDDEDDDNNAPSPYDPGGATHQLTTDVSDLIEGGSPSAAGAGTLALHDAAVAAAQQDCRVTVSYLTSSEFGCKLYNPDLACKRDTALIEDAKQSGQPMLPPTETMLSVVNRGFNLTWRAYNYGISSTHWNNSSFAKYRNSMNTLIDRIDAKVGRNRSDVTQMDRRRIIVEASQGMVTGVLSQYDLTDDMCVFGQMPNHVFSANQGSPVQQAMGHMGGSAFHGWHSIGWGNQVQNLLCSSGATHCTGLTADLLALYWNIGYDQLSSEASYQEWLLHRGQRLNGNCIRYFGNTPECNAQRERWYQECSNINWAMDTDALRAFLDALYIHDSERQQ